MKERLNAGDKLKNRIRNIVAGKSYKSWRITERNYCLWNGTTLKNRKQERNERNK